MTEQDCEQGNEKKMFSKMNARSRWENHGTIDLTTVIVILSFRQNESENKILNSLRITIKYILIFWLFTEAFKSFWKLLKA